MPDYAALKETADRLVEESGVACTVQRLAADTDTYVKKYDPATFSHYWERQSDQVRFDEPPVGSTLQWPGFVVITKWPLRKVDQINVQFTDMKLLVSVNEEVQLRDEIVIGTETYQVMNPVDRINPAADSLILQIVNGRKK